MAGFIFLKIFLTSPYCFLPITCFPHFLFVIHHKYSEDLGIFLQVVTLLALLDKSSRTHRISPLKRLNKNPF